MGKYKDKITNNYMNEIKNEIKKLKLKGFVLTPDETIYQYNIFNNSFMEIPPEQFYKIVFSQIVNYWNFPEDFNKESIQYFLFTEFNLLPVISKDKLINYVKYCNAKNYLDNENNTIGKRELNKLLKENENNKNNNSVLDLNQIETQSQLLINNNIFYDKNGLLWQYDNENELFKRVTNETIEKLYYANLTEQDKELIKNNGRQYKNIDMLENTIYNIILDNVSHSRYKEYLLYLNNVPMLWNEQKEQLNYIELYKKDFKEVNSIIKNFE